MVTVGEGPGVAVSVGVGVAVRVGVDGGSVAAGVWVLRGANVFKGGNVLVGSTAAEAGVQVACKRETGVSVGVGVKVGASATGISVGGIISSRSVKVGKRPLIVSGKSCGAKASSIKNSRAKTAAVTRTAVMIFSSEAANPPRRRRCLGEELLIVHLL